MIILRWRYLKLLHLEMHKQMDKMPSRIAIGPAQRIIFRDAQQSDE